MKRIDQFRPWQIEAIQLLRPARNALCQAPGGSGKSLTEVALAQADIDDTGNKQLILVPQNHIHHSFFGDDGLEFTLPGNDCGSRWTVANNLCETNGQTGRQLREFLLADVRALRREGRLAAISTHHAMVSLWKRLSAEEKRRALHHISFRIDEAHHISNVFHEYDLELYNQKDRQTIIDDATRLGNVVRHILRVDDPTVKLHLTTATFFRGDQKTILSKAFRKQFAHYYLPWDEYFETLDIKDLRFDFTAYDTDPVDQVLEAVRREPSEHHLVILPAITTRFRTVETLARLMEGLRQIYPADEVLDLVTPGTQAEHKQMLFRHPDVFHAVVACRLFDEGTDWVPCNRLHNTDAGEASLTLAVQRFFRPLRGRPGKTRVVIANYIPRFSPDLELGEQRAILSNRFNALLACIVTQGELMPNVIPLKAKCKGRRASNKVTIQEAYAERYHEVMQDLLRGYEKVEDKKDAAAICAVVDEVIEGHGVPEEVEPEDLRNALLVQVARIACPPTHESSRRSLEPDAIDAESIRLQGFDKVWEKASPVASALYWGTDNISSPTFRELLGVLHEIPTLGQIKDAIRAYHSRTGKRPTAAQAEWFLELERGARAVDHICRYHFGFALTQVVTQVLGDRNHELVERTREVIRDYWYRGIRLTRRMGKIPELGITAGALDARLQRNYGTSIAAEAERLLGPATDPFTLEKARLVIRNYLKKNIRLHPAHGSIPELGMTARDLDERLRRSFELTLDELVEDVKAKMIFNPYPPNLSLFQIHEGIREYYRLTGQRPSLMADGLVCGKKIKTVDALCRTYHGTSLPKEVRKILGAPLDSWRERLDAVIADYWDRGMRITTKSGHIPELGVTASAINRRLSQHYGSNLAEEFQRVTGRHSIVRRSPGASQVARQAVVAECPVRKGDW